MSTSSTDAGYSAVAASVLALSESAYGAETYGEQSHHH